MSPSTYEVGVGTNIWANSTPGNAVEVQFSPTGLPDVNANFVRWVHTGGDHGFYEDPSPSNPNMILIGNAFSGDFTFTIYYEYRDGCNTLHSSPITVVYRF